MNTILLPPLAASETSGMGCLLEYIADLRSISSLYASRELIQMNLVFPAVVV